jgi:nitrate/nitrite-specific signal transduction histidine kinase
VGQRIVIKNNDEFSQLGEVISDMSVQLGEYRENMEMKVKERTAEIEEYMDLMLGRELRMMELKKEIQRLKEQNKDESVE